MMIDENTFLSAQECREKAASLIRRGIALNAEATASFMEADELLDKAATLSKRQNNGQKL